MKPYYAAAVQPTVIGGCIDKEAVTKNLKHAVCLIDRVIDGAAQTTKGQAPKIIAFPESFLHGFGPARKRTHLTNVQLARRIPGEETERLAEKAKEYGVYIVGTLFEIAPDYPDHFFNTGFIIDPNGQVALKYRKLNTSNSNVELSTSPGDILGDYGSNIEELFPVLRTPLGNLGIYICFDGLFPEVARCMALMGAEVLIRPMGPQPTSGMEYVDVWRMINRVRAFENNAYLIAPHWADSPLSESLVSEGHSMIVDFNGNILAESDGAREHFVIAQLDVQRLRRRRRSERNNFLVQLRSEIYAKVYSARPCWPSNPQETRARGLQNLDEKWERTQEVYLRLVQRGILTEPVAEEMKEVPVGVSHS
jgi:predicted amidohydrolase